MTEYFHVSVRFPDKRFHGRKDDGENEWPPSPMRLFQALMATASRMGGASIATEDKAALCWLEALSPPFIRTPKAAETTGHVLSVPNNAMDIPAKAWSKGKCFDLGENDPAKHRALKRVKPILFLGKEPVQYLWEFSGSADAHRHVERLTHLAKHLVSLGWGIDLALGDAGLIGEEELETSGFIGWHPVEMQGQTRLRVPKKGSFDALVRHHKEFLDRFGKDGFQPPTPIRNFVMISYRNNAEPVRLPFAAFSILKPDASGFMAFDPLQHGLRVSAMLRHAAKICSEKAGRDEHWIHRHILGHNEKRGDPHKPVGPDHFAFIPLPSLEARGKGRVLAAGAIRRGLVVNFDSAMSEEIHWTKRILSGASLIREDSKEEMGILSLLPQSDRMIQRYVKPAHIWSSVTPVILPGFDDKKGYRKKLKTCKNAEKQKEYLKKLDENVEMLLRKAMRQMGFSETIVRNARLDWRKIGFRPGVEHVSRYGIPNEQKRFPLQHVRIEFFDDEGKALQVPGPIVVGSGRFKGLGLFAAE